MHGIAPVQSPLEETKLKPVGVASLSVTLLAVLGPSLLI